MIIRTRGREREKLSHSTWKPFLKNLKIETHKFRSIYESARYISLIRNLGTSLKQQENSHNHRIIEQEGTFEIPTTEEVMCPFCSPVGAHHPARYIRKERTYGDYPSNCIYRRTASSRNKRAFLPKVTCLPHEMTPTVAVLVVNSTTNTHRIYCLPGTPLGALCAINLTLLTTL